jgi:hypothetical protein
MAATLPAFHRYEEQPPLAAYHPTAVDATRCVGRRTDDDHGDRRWSWVVYAAFQCKSKPTAGSDLCETCLRREAKGTAKLNWHGRVTGDIPADSHIAGSTWFHTKTKWVGDEKPKTRRMEERAPERRLVADVEIRRFLAGAVPLNIERLSTDNQITSQQLRDMVCYLRTPRKAPGADRVNGYDKKEKLCELIRKLMDPAVTEKPVFSVHYPTAASPAASGGAGSASVSSAEDEAHLVVEDEESEALHAVIAEQAAAIVAKDTEIAALRAKMAIVEAFCAQLAVAAALSP